ncbi:initiation control protein YabA [Ferroacidibacillus organovorans]|uniref:DNA replication initiation control protein YabA n=1 Tax=Ferroacidibacillus organovorans TaxID=1765683 RepID=A0A168C392_9BACL|nr:initiation control protein YabA [Ferroacidibacillus organovorans]KYP81507.1 hypothetical protein AYJ22_07185 [Ferroacidibacillus organovorans]OAG94059.1 hypothetical protein AYW79_07460 [Ferroacidibacillus organovorans]OPG16864.1 hypothetical protein B2M26_04480 [Ferroacidibacillus organovorans]
MDQQRIAMRVQLLQERIEQLQSELQELLLVVHDLATENQRLSLENAHLHERARKYIDKQPTVEGEAMHYLRQLYEEGFHICNVNYGSLRKGDCLFCLQGLERV